MNLLSTDNQRMYFTKRRMHNKQVLRVTQSTRDHGAKLIAEMCPHFISVLQEAKKQVEFVDMDNPQMNDTVGRAFSIVFENTPYFLEWALLFPDTVHEFLAAEANRTDLIRWAIKLTRLSGLLSTEDERMIADAEQELNFVPRKHDYRNPYSIFQDMMLENEKAFRRLPEKGKRRIRRPRLTQRIDDDL
ncbi:hypothetical protein FBUS_04506 [Fasciolopsis buskii]|uniref:Uncharacterized protein n=1 Tax=Fasciolopsis buskii TaxID=27845 RepID=A0A8E0VGM0_9TREM|nr:hypothetical protein FBUS_04506 [Fasciolopsis buski]